MSLLKIGSETYIIDFEAIDRLIGGQPELKESVEEETETTYHYECTGKKELLIAKEETIRKFNKGKEIDLTKYETLKMLLDIVMTNNEEVDDTLGVARSLGKLPIPFKLAFNTLKYYQVLKSIEI